MDYRLDYRDVLISSSSNALETAVFGLSPEESDVWLKYDLDESARADLPIDVASDDETYALGMAIDRTSQQPLIISMFVWVIVSSVGLYG